jgi:hypothetical protein
LAGFGSRVFYTTAPYNSFDTHAGQLANHTRLWSETSRAVGDFYDDLKEHNAGENVMLLVFTEFGRRVKDNGSGTDDGAGGQGNRFLRATAEWHFPLAMVYSGLLAPPLGIGRIHGSLFADSAVVNRSAGKDGWLTGIGIELTTDLLIGFDSFTLPVTLGLATGLDDHSGDEHLYLRAGWGF